MGRKPTFRCAPGEDSGSFHCPGHLDRDRLLDEALHAILSTVDLQVVLQRTAAILRQFFGLTRLTLVRYVPEDPDGAEVWLVADAHRTEARQPAGVRVPLDGTAFGATIRQRREIVVEHLGRGTPRYREEQELARDGYGALACFPLLFEGLVLGALCIAHRPGHGLLGCCQESARRIAALVAIALHNSLMVEEVRHLNRLLEGENARLRDQVRKSAVAHRYVAESPMMQVILEQVRRVANSTATVLIRGETGTGKEGLAHLIHDSSPRSGGPFVTVNVGAIPESLIESELFGHERGAFTGATARRVGCFEAANGGTLFLDEVGDAPPAVQVKLLRALQDRKIQRVGGTRPVPVDVRVVAATNRPLESLVQSGEFRSDLYYRLSAVPLFVPPLREHIEDLRPLVHHFLAHLSAELSRRPPRVSQETWRVLEAYDWPGNIRELENLLERALLLHPGPDLVLPPLNPEGAPLPRGGSSGPNGDAPESRGPEHPARRPLDQGDGDLGGSLFEEGVRELLERALRASGGRIYGPGGAAERLGLKPTTLQGKLKRYRVRRD